MAWWARSRRARAIRWRGTRSFWNSSDAACASRYILQPAMTAVAVRTLLALAGGALLLDGEVLMVLRHFNLGTMLPVALGALFLVIAVWWAPLTRWRHHDPRRPP